MIWAIAGLIGIISLGIVSISAYVGWKLTHPPRREIDESPEGYGIKYQAISFKSRLDHVSLKGWFMQASSNKEAMTIIMSHGYSGSRLEKGLPALALAKTLVEAGFHVLMFDFRNCGESEGAMTTVGFLEKYDLLGAIDWVHEHQKGEIGLVGFSMGATTSILAAADAPEVLGIVADSPFDQLEPYLRMNLSVWSKLPRYPFTPVILSIMPRLTGIDPHQVDALKAVDRVYPRPILFIHSRGDTAIPLLNSESMRNKHPDRFQLWITEKAGHVGSYQQEPQVYADKVISFFSNLQNERNSSLPPEYKDADR